MKSPETVELVELEGNNPVLVRMSAPVDRKLVLMSRETGMLRAATRGNAGQCYDWLNQDDYLLLSCEEAAREAVFRTRTISRFLVCEGQTFVYAAPTLLRREPAHSLHALLPAPTTAQLVSCGRVSGEARIVARWVAAAVVVICVAIRHEGWHGDWLFFKAEAPSIGICLPDGAYEARAALLDEQDAVCSEWSDVCGFSVAEGRLCVAGGRDDLADTLSVRRTWVAHAAFQNASLRGVPGGRPLVHLDWISSRPMNADFIVYWVAEDECAWHTLICSEPSCDLELEPGTYRIRLAACDLAAVQRSIMLAEAVLEVSAAEVRLRALISQGSTDWTECPVIDQEAMDEVGKDAIQHFKDQALAPLSEYLAKAAASRPVATKAGPLVAMNSARDAIEDFLEIVADPGRLAAKGEAFATAGQLEDARRIFESYRRQFRQDSMGPGWLGRIAEREGGLRQALDLYSAASLFPGQANWLYDALRMHLAVGDDSPKNYASKILDLMACDGWAKGALVALAALRGETLSGPVLSALFAASCLESPILGSGGKVAPTSVTAADDNVNQLASQPLVSIILPLSHQGALPLSAFSEPVLSIANQSYANTEIVICTPTARMASHFSETFGSTVQKMKFCECSENWMGACLGAAEGEYLTVLDPRIVSHRERVARQLEAMGDRSIGSACYGLSTQEDGRPLLPAVGPLHLVPESLLVRRSTWERHFAGYVGDRGYRENLLQKFVHETVVTVPLPLCVVYVTADDAVV